MCASVLLCSQSNPVPELAELFSQVRSSDISGPGKKKKKKFVCLSICWILTCYVTYYVNEVDRCCGVQVPVQLVQNDPLHAKNLCCRKVAPALHNQVSNRAYYLFQQTPTNASK